MKRGNRAAVLKRTLTETRLLEDAKETAWELRNDMPDVADLLRRLHERVEELGPIQATLDEAREEAQDLISEAENDAADVLETAEFEADDILTDARAEAKAIIERAKSEQVPA